MFYYLVFLGIDLLWADPDQWAKGWQANTRGVSYVFGQDVVIEACAKLDIDLVARAHQVCFGINFIKSIFLGRSRWL